MLPTHVCVSYIRAIMHHFDTLLFTLHRDLFYLEHFASRFWIGDAAPSHSSRILDQSRVGGSNIIGPPVVVLYSSSSVSYYIGEQKRKNAFECIVYRILVLLYPHFWCISVRDNDVCVRAFFFFNVTWLGVQVSLGSVADETNLHALPENTYAVLVYSVVYI